MTRPSPAVYTLLHAWYGHASPTLATTLRRWLAKLVCAVLEDGACTQPPGVPDAGPLVGANLNPHRRYDPAQRSSGAPASLPGLSRPGGAPQLAGVCSPRAASRHHLARPVPAPAGRDRDGAATEPAGAGGAGSGVRQPTGLGCRAGAGLAVGAESDHQYGPRVPAAAGAAPGDLVGAECGRGGDAYGDRAALGAPAPARLEPVPVPLHHRLPSLPT